MQSRHILITGASSGIGLAAARQLARAGHRLTLPCRSQTRVDALAEVMAKDGGIAQVSSPLGDLADLASVETLAAGLLQDGRPIDTLVLNAGLQYSGASAPRWSPQGFELTLAVNHLAHQSLLQRLLPLVLASPRPRVVVTASEVHDPTTPGGRVGLAAGVGTLEGLRQGPGAAMVNGTSPFNAEKAYKDSKLCNLLMARALANQHRQLPVLAWSPGLVIPRGGGGFFRYSREHNPLGQALFALLARDLLRLSETPARAGALLAGLAADQAPATGFSYRSNRLVGPGQLRFEEREPSAEASDDALAAQLWQLSAALVGLQADQTLNRH
ncbi:MAG: SDR family NAD(P)-dependent oxidoreductase [Cyanobium sp. M30B3]|nr:MAG: SDR family NAD(P)-dependent oxidoreductase [Cyanobium sp. M30B3]